MVFPEYKAKGPVYASDIRKGYEARHDCLRFRQQEAILNESNSQYKKQKKAPLYTALKNKLDTLNITYSA